jgi:hypothetical protein
MGTEIIRKPSINLSNLHTVFKDMVKNGPKYFDVLGEEKCIKVLALTILVKDSNNGDAL